MQTTIYQHCEDQGAISYDPANRQLVITNDDAETSATVLIGKHGMRELANELLKLADAPT